MSTQENNRINENYSDDGSDMQGQTVCCEEAVAYAETLLDRVEAAQNQIQCLSDNIALLQTLENALDLIGENLSKIWRLAKIKQRGDLKKSELSSFEDTFRNLSMVNMLIIEDTEFNGHLLFKDDIIKLDGSVNEKLCLITSRIPEITDIETDDFSAVFDSLSVAAGIINRQYKRIGDAMSVLINDYQLVRNEIDKMLTAQAHVQ